MFLDWLNEARKGEIQWAHQQQFAKYREISGGCCITFNYDGFFNEALELPCRWKPNWGYGFFCPPSLGIIASLMGLETHSVLRLAMVHGSINWRPKPEYPSPVAIDCTTHYQDWRVISQRNLKVVCHTVHESAMVPTASSNSSLVDRQVL